MYVHFRVPIGYLLGILADILRQTIDVAVVKLEVFVVDARMWGVTGSNGTSY
jgi:hypothetical protein